MEVQKEAARIQEFCGDRLGPCCQGVASKPVFQTLVLNRMREGSDLEDAVLAEVHALACQDRAMADEFLAFFLSDLHRTGHAVLTDALRRYLDTQDLVQSVLGDVWPRLDMVEFRTRGEFLSYLKQRIRWKARDRSRGLKAQRRREDRRVDGTPEDLGLSDGRPSPGTEIVNEEERDRLILVLARLPEPDRVALRFHLMGESVAAIARALEVETREARNCVQRAVKRARALAPT